jgi:hypothetical protein
VAARVVADATAGADLELEVRRSAEARQDFPWAVAHQSVEARRSRGPAAVHLDQDPQPWRDHRSAERHRTFPDSCRRVQSEHWAPRSPERPEQTARVHSPRWPTTPIRLSSRTIRSRSALMTMAPVQLTPTTTRSRLTTQPTTIPNRATRRRTRLRYPARAGWLRHRKGWRARPASAWCSRWGSLPQ